MTRSPQPERSEVVRAAQRLGATGLSSGTSGNLSRRLDDGFLITPSALPYERTGEDDVVEMVAGEVVSSSRRPSTEWPFHAAIYAARPEVGGVVHAHPPYATALSCARREIPPFHYMVGVAGGRSIRCAGYARPGSEALAELAVGALAGRNACLLANHGMISVGATLPAAFDLALEVETLARQYWLTLQIGEPVLLSGDEMEEILAHLEVYRSSGARE